MNPANKYAQTQNETASPERLMVLLFTTALRHIRTAIRAFEEGRVHEAPPLLFKASDIVVELHATLDRSQSATICDSLAAVYQFTALRLTRAAMTRNVQLAVEAERAFAPIVDAFEQAVALQHRPLLAGVR